MVADSEEPTEVALLKMLEIQWQDHFQTREQVWKSLNTAALVAAAVVGLDWAKADPLVPIVVAILLVFVAAFGIGITLKSREVERQKFAIIMKIEDALHLDSLIPGRQVPAAISLRSIISRQSNNPLFILRMHFVILLFAIAYLVLRLLPGLVK